LQETSGIIELKMFFSVVIPTCSRNDLLALCLSRLGYDAQQLERTKYEVIVTDDGPNSEAKSLIEKSYPWVRWVAGPKKGPAANRNNGARYATGDWLVFIDDDCLPEMNILNKYIEGINDNEKINVFEGSITAAGERTSPLEYAPINTVGGALWSCNFAIRKHFFEDLAGFDENFRFPHMEDVDLRTRIASSHEDIVFLRSARVIHPWRKITDGKKLGSYQEMYVYFHAKHSLKISMCKLMRSIVGVHISMIRSALFSADFFKSVKIMFEHLYIVTLNYSKWKKKYGA